MPFLSSTSLFFLILVFLLSFFHYTEHCSTKLNCFINALPLYVICRTNTSLTDIRQTVKTNVWWKVNERMRNGWETDVLAVQNCFKHRSNGNRNISNGRCKRSKGTGEISNGWHEPFERRTKNLERALPAVRTATEKFRTVVISRSSGWGKISNGCCQPFEQLTKGLERVTPGVRTVKETIGTWFQAFERAKKRVRSTQMVINGSAAKCGRSWCFDKRCVLALLS